MKEFRITEEMIIETVKGDWQNFRNGAKMNSIATVKRILSELGSLINDSSIRQKVYEQLWLLNEKDSSDSETRLYLEKLKKELENR